MNDRTLEDVAGFVLAGGLSSRMGSDKALLELDGFPLVARAIDVLQRAGLSVTIAGAHSELPSFAPVIPDLQAGLGPLSGICAAFAHSTAQCGVFVPVDMPLLPHSLIEFLVAHALATNRLVTLCSVSGFPQTFPAVIHRDALPALQHELQAGVRGCFAAFHAAARQAGDSMSVLPIELLVQSGHIEHPAALPPFRWFLNVNTRDDLDRAGSIASHRVS